MINLTCEGPIMVIGDVMLDVEVTGKVTKISAEAPTPVLDVEHEKYSPGGAANVAANLAALGLEVTLIGAVGPRSAALEHLEDALSQYPNIDHQLFGLADKTTVKTRVLSDGHQMLRLDVDGDASKARYEIHKQALNLSNKEKYAAVVLVDHSKGLFNYGDEVNQLPIELMRHFRHVKIPVYVDPKDGEWCRFSGATLIKPNQKSAQLYRPEKRFGGGVTSTFAQLHSLVVDRTFNEIVVTRGSDGMTLINANGIKNFPTREIPIRDVTGAGDTAMATLVAAHMTGWNTPMAIEIANVAAGIAASRPGTSTVSWLELSLEYSKLANTHCKRFYAQEAAKIGEELRRLGKRVVFTNGCFDLLHPGHIEMLNKSKNYGEVLVVAINTDESVSTLKGDGHPFVPFEQRAAVIQELSCVDLVVPFSFEEELKELVRELKVLTLTKGEDYKDKVVTGLPEVVDNGGNLVFIPHDWETSSSQIVKRIQNRA